MFALDLLVIVFGTVAMVVLIYYLYKILSYVRARIPEWEKQFFGNTEIKGIDTDFHYIS